MKRTFVVFLTLLLFAQMAHAQKIGILIDSYFIDRWYTDTKVLSATIKQLGGEFVIEDPKGDPNEQIRLGKKLINEGINALIIVAIDGKKAIEIVEAAEAKNIPVVAYDRFIKSKAVDFYVSYDNKMVGRLQAKYALEKAPAGNYLLVNGPVSDNNAILFREGQLEVLKPAIDSKKIKIVGDVVLNDWSEMEAMMKVDEFLTDNKGNPNVLIAANDALATGALQSIPEGASKMVIVGQDAETMAIRNIIKGDQTMTIYKPIVPLATMAADVAMKLAKKQAIPTSTKFVQDGIEVGAIQLTPMVVDKTNYNETVVKDGFVSLNK